MDSLLDQQESHFNDTDPFLHVYRHAITLHLSPLLLSRYGTESAQTSPRKPNDWSPNTPTKQTSVPRSLTLNDLPKQTPRRNHGHEDTTAESRVLVPRRGTSNIPAKISPAASTTTQKTVTVAMYAANHRPYEVPIKFFHQQATKRSRLEQIFASQMQGGTELLSWLDVVRPELFTQIPGFVFPPGDSFLSLKESINLIGGLTDQRDVETYRLSQLTAKFLREYFANMSMGDRPLLYKQAHTDDQKIAFHKSQLHDIFFSIQVHRRKQNKNIVGDPNKGPNPLVTRTAKERYIQGACFYIHPAVMKKVVQHVVEARRTFLDNKKKQAQAQPRGLPQASRSGSIRSLRKAKSCGSILKGSEKPNSNKIIPLVPIPTEDWGRRDPEAYSEFPRLRNVQERMLVYYQFARSVDGWMWRLTQAEMNAGFERTERKAECGLGQPEPKRASLEACNIMDAKDTELLIEL
ncbi:hypothetical protein QBC45DRAFT_480272 [Copromyces sp. CBS 386.78]|nr:hypothetical protein QBC45DRAFT_480272 [Copromyces sp. CBS 386.78]